jgi:hypothetical protein
MALDCVVYATDRKDLEKLGWFLVAFEQVLYSNPNASAVRRAIRDLFLNWFAWSGQLTYDITSVAPSVDSSYLVNDASARAVFAQITQAVPNIVAPFINPAWTAAQKTVWMENQLAENDVFITDDLEDM